MISTKVAVSVHDGLVSGVPFSVDRLRELLADRPDSSLVSLDGQRADETYVLEHRGSGWLVYFLERGTKHGFKKHKTEDEACRDLLGRLND